MKPKGMCNYGDVIVLKHDRERKWFGWFLFSFFFSIYLCCFYVDQLDRYVREKVGFLMRKLRYGFCVRLCVCGFLTARTLQFPCLVLSLFLSRYSE